MRLYCYTMTHDTGFAPNPYWGYCTFATCKPVIRRTALAGDWIVGTGSANKVGRGKLVFAMKVAESLPLDAYDRDPRFQSKKPVYSSGPRQRCGDNIYYNDSDGRWQQRRSLHQTEHMEHDLGGKNALVATDFYYFGKDAIEIPAPFAEKMLIVRGHRSNTDASAASGFLNWLTTNFTMGIHGIPYDFDASSSCSRMPTHQVVCSVPASALKK